MLSLETNLATWRTKKALRVLPFLLENYNERPVCVTINTSRTCMKYPVDKNRSHSYLRNTEPNPHIIFSLPNHKFEIKHLLKQTDLQWHSLKTFELKYQHLLS